MDQSPSWTAVGRDALLSYRTAHPEPGVAVVGIRGEMDLATAPLMADELAAVRRTGPERLVVDLGGVAFLSSAGIGALLKLDVECGRDGVDLALIPSEPVRRVLTLAGLTECFTIIEPPSEEADRRRLA
ncbi:STAS domain-containing protein [Amycolatopsis mongoliensis]|uniref:Anti-sigma factor antagonist n=1 Tax=Amycolatopsis mongoliensis TaxID=715475 RepID=A0A9Y2JJZ9_9PSEU|nr:STAS domain-containing protein [Amycolatopsis sp. 4-36]WIX98703.1 STAS domain-containing protein [Amycolatopsis sp. 4-36]